MTKLLREKRRAVRRRPLLAVLFVLAIAGVVSVAGSGRASSTTATCSTSGTLDATDPSVNGGQSNFEIDAAVVGGTVKKPINSAGANLKLDGPSPCIDWASVGTAALVKPDKPSGSGDDSFTQGTSENDETPVISTGSIPPNKSDLQDFGVYREANSSGKFLDLFWSRVNAPSGTVDMDFELNKLVCDGTAATCSANGSGQYVIPLRSDGDRLITYDLANGGTVPTISIYTWSGTATSGSWTNGTTISGVSHEALGSINFDPILAGDSDGLGAKDPLTFGEVSVSYKALFGSGGTSGCGSFGSVYLKSRSSNTFTDELKDFVAPEAVQITNCTTLTTQASNAPSGTAATIGGTITDTATLSNAQSPTNGIVFKAYGPFDPTTPIANDKCDDTATTGNLRYTTSPAIALTGPDSSGNYTASTPSSGTGAFTPAAAGRYEWIASYAADASNGASAGKCGDANEQSIVAPVTPTLATVASNGTTGQALGSAINDRATLTGTANKPDGNPAGGSITFKLYGPATSATCIDSGAGANLVYTSSAIPVSGDRSGTSYYGPASYTPTAAGTYYWVASYSGDSPNTNPKSGTCGDAGETSIVSPNTPTLSTTASAGTVGVTPGTALDDTAHLGNTAPEPDGTAAKGTITFKLYGPATTATCIDPGTAGANLVGTVTISVSGNGDYKASNGTLQSGGTVSPTAAGTYYWTASYGGDPPNTSSVSEACGGATESSIVVKLNSTITTNQAWTPQDSATIDHSGGTVTFSLYKNAVCTGTPVYGPDTENVTGSGPYVASTNNTSYSVSAVTQANGDTYYWKAAYTSGDAQHKDVTSACTEATTITSISNGSSTQSP